MQETGFKHFTILTTYALLPFLSDSEPDVSLPKPLLTLPNAVSFSKTNQRCLILQATALSYPKARLSAPPWEPVYTILQYFINSKIHFLIFSISEIRMCPINDILD